jgi:hypothetical protein
MTQECVKCGKVKDCTEVEGCTVVEDMGWGIEEDIDCEADERGEEVLDGERVRLLG